MEAFVRNMFSTPFMQRAPRAAVVTHMTRYNAHTQERRWSYPSEKTACQSDLRFKSYELLHNVTCDSFDGVYGQCKPGFNVSAHVLLETEHYLAENFIFDDRQYEQHARRRREISFSSVEFESLSFGSEENELGACVMLIWWGPSTKHRFSTKHDLRRARSRPHPSSDLCENLMDQISQVYIFCQKSFKSVTASAFELFSNHSMTHGQNPKKSGQRFYN